MLQECVEVFNELLQKEKKENRDLILDTYIPADGTYVIVGKDGDVRAKVEIKMDTKTRQIEKTSPYFKDICFFDYYSRLISMNKPIDGKKIIHSNNYLSFFVKKDSIVSGKLTDEIIDGYYDVLSEPVEKKYKKSKEAVGIYSIFEEQEGGVSKENIDEKKQWIKNHIYHLDEVDMSKKDYLKVFFESDKEIFVREGSRYFLPNIYNNNDYNVEVEGVVYGLPDNNLGMNAKKPFLAFKSKKYPASYLLNSSQVMQQKGFFDYLMNLACAGTYNIYIDTTNCTIQAFTNEHVPKSVESGYFLRIKKGKEVEIHLQDNIAGYRNLLEPKFDFKDYIGSEHKWHPEYRGYYGYYGKRLEVGALINEVFFSKWLSGNYFTEASDMSNITDVVLKESILLSRAAIFSWVYIGMDRGFAGILDRVSMNLIKGTVLKGEGYKDRVLWQLNLRWSFREYLNKGGEDMGEIISGIKESVEKKVLREELGVPECDKEYYYAVGQLTAFLLSLSKTKDLKQSLLNPIINAKSDAFMKERIMQLYKKYNYRIPQYSRRFNNLMTMVEGYRPDSPLNQENQEMIILGYANGNVMYTKEEKENE